MPHDARQGQRIDLYALCLNEAKLIPHFLRHYSDLVSRFFIFDNGSTDGSIGLLRGDERVSVQSFETNGESFVEVARNLLGSAWKASRGTADWVIVVEIDEHLHHDDLSAYLLHSYRTGITAIRAIGFNMVAASFPNGPAPLWQQVTRGVRSRDFDKLAIFRPDAIGDTNFAAGRHADSPTGHVAFEPHRQVKLLHFKYLGIDYLCERNAMLAGGLRSQDRVNLWGSHYLRDRSGVAADVRDLTFWSRRVPGLASGGPLDLTWDDERTSIEESGLFEEQHYRAAYPDVSDSRFDPLDHFCSFGWREGRWPNRHFDPAWYRARYADAVPPDVNPLLEYIVAGERAGRMPVPYFDPSLYRHQHGLGLAVSPLRALLANGSDQLVPQGTKPAITRGVPTQ